jgi:hypothetical protein
VRPEYNGKFEELDEKKFPILREKIKTSVSSIVSIVLARRSNFVYVRLKYEMLPQQNNSQQS